MTDIEQLTSHLLHNISRFAANIYIFQMRIALCRLNIDVNENIGHFIQAHSVLNQPRSTGVAKIVAELIIGLNGSSIPVALIGSL